MKRIDAVHALITDESKSKVLMVYNIDHQCWSLPGGRVEAGETLDQAIIRETKEETGLEIRIIDIVSIGECKFIKANNHIIFTAFRAEIINDSKIEIIHPEEISDIRWIDFTEADKHAPYYQGKLKELSLRDGVKYINRGLIDS